MLSTFFLAAYSAAIFFLSMARDFFIVKGHSEVSQAAALIGFVITLNYSSSIFTDYLMNNAAWFKTVHHLMLLVTATITFAVFRGEAALVTAFVLCSLSTAQICGEQIVKGRYSFSQMIVCIELAITIGVLVFIRSGLTAPVVVGLRLALAYAVFIIYRLGAGPSCAGLGSNRTDVPLLVCNSLFLASLVWANKVFYGEAVSGNAIMAGRSVNYLLGFATVFFNVIADKLMFTKTTYLPVGAAGTIVAAGILAHQSALIGTMSMFITTSVGSFMGIFSVRVLSRVKRESARELISSP